MKKKFLILALPFLLFACNKPVGELVGLGTSDSFKEATPYGMVYIKRGSFLMGPNDQSVMGSVDEKLIQATIDAFWMDDTEITNDEYKQFVVWVRDSVARRALVLAGRDEYLQVGRDQLYEDLDPETSPLNWKTKIPWDSQDEEISDILSFMYYDSDNMLSIKKEFNPGSLQYRYEWVNTDQVAIPQNRYEQRRCIS